MSLYEHVFICRQDISQQQVETLTENLTAILTEQGGSIEKTEYWGLRSLAYRVKKNRKGHYSLLNITADHTAISEMERQMSLNDDILRFMTIRVEEHDEEPSAPLSSKNKDERKRRDYNDNEGSSSNAPTNTSSNSGESS
ncbi:MAG: 30S ribosomal protein S6 [Candidatus Micropelagos sp.]|uniref:Small ribosomal subunit protein bS6 n=1 Tax=PS1 clade bacterium TaxID=2175152 RepID=A0A368EFT1_9PROT|nr:30S ribosomal protein S6 [Hyphomicrobiales bacterium]OUV50112.1 MAG: 30S ribosomal protein S6 [Alphaproteobacteria bacterium TMED110]RCL82998.1 MAG: 30S ribosomal protein S6 [PS1 clade bacterium]